MRWMKHIASARHDEKMALLLDEHGPAGYGVYWLIVEIIGEKVTDTCTKVEFPERFWRKNLGVSRQKLEVFLDFFKKNELFFVEKNKTLISIDCPNILKYRDEYTDKQLKKSGVNPDSIGTKSRTETDTDTEKETDTEKDPPISPQGDGGEKSIATPKPATGLAAEIMREYNAILPELEPALVMSSAMSRHLNLNRQEHPERGHIDFWVGLFHKARALPHLMGRLKGSNWKASLPWLLIPDNVDNIINGKYSQANGEEKKHGTDYGHGVRPMGAKPRPQKN